MAEQHVSIPLVMATRPQETVRGGFATKRGYWFNRFNVILLIQKLGIILLIGILSIPAYFFISQYLVKSVKVVGTSMVPTLQPGGSYLLDRWAFRDREPQRDDVVVIRDPGDHGLSVKRIVAVSGESILFKNGSVYVNGKKLTEPYLLPHTLTFTYAQAKEQFITCGKDQFFVLGDNRLVSVDSRAYGPVSRKDILGLVKVK